MITLKSKVTEIWDEDCGWRYYCDNCGTHLNKKTEEEVKTFPPARCNNCGAELSEIERC